MSAKTFYLNNGISSNVQQAMSETSPGANSTTSPNYGWTTGTTVIDRWASADAQTLVPAASFGTTEQPDGTIVTTAAAGDCWRTPVPLHGLFVAGTWTFQLSAVQGGGGSGGAGRAEFRLFKSTSSDGSGATQLTSGIVNGGIISIGISQTDSIGTVSLGDISLANEYLFIQIGWKITTVATGMTASTFAVVIRVGTTASQMVTTDFVQTAGQTEMRQSGNCTNVADVNVDWTSPANAQTTDGDVAQFISTVLTFDQLSDFLNANTFGFTAGELLDSDIVTSILAESDLNADIASECAFNSVRLVINGSVTGSDKSDASDLPTVLTIKAWTWSGGDVTGLTGADLKLTNSGIRLQLIEHNGLGVRGRVDQMRMRVYFTRVTAVRSGVALSGGASMSF